ncbi:MAG: hypothetical protein M1374_06180 [Firmicutes bacterium]|jgi:4-amino-4-deoxy-L-arabinose transferase-like glycosyltransferase|nr:hypothetical protein [Bacillota bacterium]
MSDSDMSFKNDQHEGLPATLSDDESAQVKKNMLQRLTRLALIFGVLAIIAFAVLLRLLIIGREPINSDEAVVGLMAHEILHGHFFAFYWGQNYGGVEPYFVAAVFLIFGQSTFSLAVTPIILDFVAAFILFRIGKKFFSFNVALGASLLFLIWPEVYVWQSTIEYGFRFAALVIGLAMVLLVLNIIDIGSKKNSAMTLNNSTETASADRQSSISFVSKWRFANKDTFYYLLLGLLSGLGWWATPEIVYFAIPLAFLIIYSLIRKKFRISLMGLILFLLGAAIGAIPWLYDNVGKGFPSLKANTQVNSSITEHFRVFVTHVLPMVLGLRLVASGDWLWKEDFGLAVYALFLCICLIYFVISIKEKKNFFLIAFLVLFPFLYAYSPVTWYWQDGRYALYLAPFLALYLVAAVEGIVLRLSSRLRYLIKPSISASNDKDEINTASVRSLPKAALQKVSTLPVVMMVIVGLVFTLGAAAKVSPFIPKKNVLGESSWLSFDQNATGWLQPALIVLHEHHIKDAFAGYWLAYPLAFMANGNLTVSPTLFLRYTSYYLQVEKADKVAWIFPNPSRFAEDVAEVSTTALNPGCIGGYRTKAVPVYGLSGCLALGEIESYLHHINDSYQVLYMGDLLAVVPDKNINPHILYRTEHIKDGYKAS